MTWTFTKPPTTGWYLYREPGEDVDKPRAAWVYVKRAVVYVYIFSPHTELPSIDHGQPKDFAGEWWGPVEVPD
jgi:hypothetical protein